jgi:hypothetical protein
VPARDGLCQAGSARHRTLAGAERLERLIMEADEGTDEALNATVAFTLAHVSAMIRFLTRHRATAPEMVF